MRVGGQGAHIKGFLRACEKVILDYDNDVLMLTDLVRGKLYCGSIHQMREVTTLLLRADPSLGAILNGWSDAQAHAPALASLPAITLLDGKMRIRGAEALGDCIFKFIICSDPRQHVCELQVVLSKVEVAKGALGGHDSYTLVRSVQALLDALPEDTKAHRRPVVMGLPPVVFVHQIVRKHCRHMTGIFVKESLQPLYANNADPTLVLELCQSRNEWQFKILDTSSPGGFIICAHMECASICSPVLALSSLLVRSGDGADWVRMPQAAIEGYQDRSEALKRVSTLAAEKKSRARFAAEARVRAEEEARKRAARETKLKAEAPTLVINFFNCTVDSSTPFCHITARFFSCSSF